MCGREENLQQQMMLNDSKSNHMWSVFCLLSDVSARSGPINREMRHLISSLQNHNLQLKGDVQRYKRKLRETQMEINKVDHVIHTLTFAVFLSLTFSGMLQSNSCGHTGLFCASVPAVESPSLVNLISQGTP